MSTDTDKVARFNDSHENLIADISTIRDSLRKLKNYIGNVKAFTVVATIFTAIQAQLLSLTYQRNDNKLETVTNVFSFIAFSFDAIGIATGLDSATALQVSIAHYQKAAVEANKSLATWKEISSELRRFNSKKNVSTNRPGASEDHDILNAKESARNEQNAELEGKMKSWETMEEKRKEEYKLVVVDKIVPYTQESVPVGMMAIGVLFFLLTLVFFAISSQPRSVWIPTLACIVGGWYSKSYLQLFPDYFKIIRNRGGNTLEDLQNMYKNLLRSSV